MLAIQLYKGDELLIRTRDGYEMTVELSRIDQTSAELKLHGPAWFQFVRTAVSDKPHVLPEFGSDKSQSDYLRSMLENQNGSLDNDP